MSFQHNYISIKQFKQVGSVISAFQNAGDSEGSIHGIRNAIKTFDGLSYSQQKAILNSNLLEEAQKEHLATQAGLTITTEGQVVATNELTGAQVGATGTTTSLSTAFKGLWASMKPVLVGLATNPLTWLVALGAAAIALEDYLTIDYSEAHDALDESSSKYEESASSLESLNSELETTQSRIKELQALSDNGTISLAEEAELETLRVENEELERKIELQEKLLAFEKQEAINDAKVASETGDHSVAQSVKFGDSTGKSSFKGEVGKVTDTEAIKEDIALIEEYEDKVEAAERRVNNATIKYGESGSIFDKLALKQAEDELENYRDSIETLQADLTTRSESAQKNLELLELDPDSNADKIREIKEALDSVNSIDLTPTQKDLKMIESYFDGSVGKNAIKDRLKDAVESGDNLEDVMKELGLSLDDLSVDNIENLERYFEELINSTDEAKKSVQDYAATVSEVEEAFETDNQDNDWSTISEKYKEAKELLKEGKTGTDDFQIMASYLNPDLLKKEAEKNGQYSADAYQKAFEAAQKTANRWFGEDETKSMQNFVNDFKKKGLFDVKTDSNGLWDISANFETSAEAAEQFGMSIEAVETMLHALEAYGYDETIGDIDFSGEALQEYNSYLSQIQETMDSVEDEDLRLELKAILDEESKIDYEEKIEDLTPDVIQKIKIVADISQYDAEISKLKAMQENNGFSDTSANAEILGTYEARNAYRYDNFSSNQKKKLEKDKGYSTLESAEDSLTKSIKGAKSDEERIEFQKQKLAVEEFKATYLDEFKDSGISWDDFLKTSEAQDTLDEVVDTYGIGKDEIKTLFGDDIEVAPIHVEVDADEVEKTLDDASAGSTVTFTAEIDGQGERTIEALKDEKGNITYTANIDGVEKQVLPFIDPITNEVTYVVAGDEEVKNKSEEVKDSVDSIESKNVEVSSPGSESTKTELDNVAAAANSVPSKVIVSTIISGYENAKTKLNNLKTKWREITGSLGGSGVQQYQGTAHALGTSVSKSIPYNVLSDSRYRTKDGQVALTGELGRELVVHGDKWWTVGDNGAEFAKIPPNSIVFNHEQTKQLLRNGSINSRGTACLYGTTHLKGDANLRGTAYRLGGTTSGGTSGSSTTKNNSSNNNNSTTTTADPEEFDWIERKIKAIETAIDRLKGKAEATYKSWSTRNTALSSELTQVKKEISTQEKAYSYYMKKANSVKFSSSEKKYRDLVANGKISISSIKDENLAEKIKKYQDYYDKAQDCKDAIQELNDTVAEIAKQKFENIMQEWEDKLSDSEYEIEKLNAQMELLEEQGYEVDESYYKKLISEENNNIANLKSEKSALEKSLNEAVKSGSIKKYSEDWYALKNEIRDVDIEIINGQKDLASYNNELRQIKWDAWEKGHEALEKTRDELETMLNLLDGNDLFDEDTGEFTDFGMASQGIHVLKYQSYMDDVKKYADEIKEIKKDLDDDPNNTKLQEKYDELIEKQRDAAEGAKSEQDAIKDLASEYNDALLDALNKIIDKRKEALDDMSSLLDYERDVTDQTKNIASLEKQLMAAKADKSEAGRAKAQRLQEELDEAKKDLEQTEYDKWVEDQEKMMDNLANDYEDFLSNRLENTEKLISDAIDATNNASTDIRKTLAELASSYGLELSDDLKSLLKTDDEIAAEKAEEALKNNTTLPSMTESPSNEPEEVTSTIGSTSPSTTKDKDATTTPSTKNTWGSWFIKKTYSGKKTKSSTSIVDFNESTLNTLNCGNPLRA